MDRLKTLEDFFKFKGWLEIKGFFLIRVGFYEPINSTTISHYVGEIYISTGTGQFFVSTRASDDPMVSGDGSLWVDLMQVETKALQAILFNFVVVNNVLTLPEHIDMNNP